MSESAHSESKIRRLGEICTMRRGITYNKDFLVEKDNGTPYVNMKSISKGGGLNEVGIKYFSGSYTELDLLKDDDILIANTDVTLDGDIIGYPGYLSEGLIGTKVLFSHHITRIRLTSKINHKYLFYLLCLDEYHRWMKKYARGTTVLMLDAQAIKLIPIRLLGYESQARIVSILTTLDRLIEQTEALITKYEAIKQGMMHDLFTRGIDENGQLRPPHHEAPHLYKPSPLGPIPKSWSASPLGELLQEPLRNGLYKQAVYYGTGCPMVHMPQMFRSIVVDVSDAVLVDVEPVELQRYGLEEGDLLFARRSIKFEGAGQCSIMPKPHLPTTFESSIIRARLNPSIVNPMYINHFLSTGAGYQQRFPFIRQVAVSGVSGQDIREFKVPVPDCRTEQDLACDRIDNIDRKIDAESKSVLKLKMKKMGLMQDLLTGKVRVPVDDDQDATDGH